MTQIRGSERVEQRGASTGARVELFGQKHMKIARALGTRLSGLGCVVTILWTIQGLCQLIGLDPGDRGMPAGLIWLTGLVMVLSGLWLTRYADATSGEPKLASPGGAFDRGALDAYGDVAPGPPGSGVNRGR